MKLLSSAGMMTTLVQQATSTATADGQYGSYIALDWSANFTEVRTTAAAATLGLAPNV